MTLHAFTDEGDERQYWTQTPNIVFELRLKPAEFVLYSHIKRAAGAKKVGKCTKSTTTLARETGLGTGTVSRAKKELEKPRAALGNKSLIRTKEVPNPKGGKAFHEITVTDIWRENIARFTSSPVEVALDQVPNEVEASSKPSSTVEIKKNSKKNDQEERVLLDDLIQDPAYSHVDVSVEFQKAQRWCALNHRKLTPRFFVNWLNRIDRPFRPLNDPGTHHGNGKHDAAWHAKQAELARKLGREYRPDA